MPRIIHVRRKTRGKEKKEGGQQGWEREEERYTGQIGDSTNI